MKLYNEILIFFFAVLTIVYQITKSHSKDMRDKHDINIYLQWSFALFLITAFIEYILLTKIIN